MYPDTRRHAHIRTHARTKSRIWKRPRRSSPGRKSCISLARARMLGAPRVNIYSQHADTHTHTQTHTHTHTHTDTPIEQCWSEPLITGFADKVAKWQTSPIAEQAHMEQQGTRTQAHNSPSDRHAEAND